MTLDYWSRVAANSRRSRRGSSCCARRPTGWPRGPPSSIRLLTHPAGLLPRICKPRGRRGTEVSPGRLRHRLCARDRRRRAGVADAEAVACASVVAAAGVVHPFARVGRLASPLGRLARSAVPVCGRDAVHRVDVAAGRRDRGAVAMAAARAALPGVDHLETGRLERVGNRRRLRASVIA